MWWKTLIFFNQQGVFSWFVIGYFLSDDVANDVILLFFLGMRFPGVILAPVAPIATEKQIYQFEVFPPLFILVQVVLID